MGILVFVEFGSAAFFACVGPLYLVGVGVAIVGYGGFDYILAIGESDVVEYVMHVGVAFANACERRA